MNYVRTSSGGMMAITFKALEVIPVKKLLEIGSWQKAKQKGMVRLEGKDYKVQDGDVVEIKHS